MNQDSIFTKIIKGEIPSHKVYEDEHTYAFLDIYPSMPGLVLVVPKKQVEFVWDLDDENYQALMATTKKVALRLREVFPEATRIGLQIEGLDVAHAHAKIFPFSNGNEFIARADRSIEPNHAELAEMAKKIVF
jgi:histidine triad (HIT) family protein